jgi:single-strand DNA-binding protein
MLNLNRAQILGNLTRDPEMRFTPNGQAVSSFSVATNRRWTNRDSGEQQEQVEFHNIVVWGKQAESVSPMLKKGQPVYVEGRIQTRSWEGQDGVKRYKTEIVADSVIVLTSRSQGAAAAEDNQENPVEEVAKSDSKKPDDKKSDIDEKPKDDGKTKDNEVEEIDIEDIPF